MDKIFVNLARLQAWVILELNFYIINQSKKTLFGQTDVFDIFTYSFRGGVIKDSMYR